MSLIPLFKGRQSWIERIQRPICSGALTLPEGCFGKSELYRGFEAATKKTGHDWLGGWKFTYKARRPIRE